MLRLSVTARVEADGSLMAVFGHEGTDDDVGQIVLN
jgi:hypothetical protein